MNLIFHITTQSAWDEASKKGSYSHSSLEIEGFIHCSTKEQVPGTLTKHFKGKTDLVLLEINEEVVKDFLKYEVSEGLSFPHVYGVIPIRAVLAVKSI